MMQINLDKNKPWLQQTRIELFKLALKETNGDKQKAAELLGCSLRTVKTEVKKYKELEVYYKPVGNTKNFTDTQVLTYFNLQMTVNEIAKRLNTFPENIRTILEKKLGNNFEKLHDKNKYLKHKGMRMFNTKEILENNRVILAEIAEKVRENKVDELSQEYYMYAKILLNNGLINSKGEVTEEGKTALYQ